MSGDTPELAHLSGELTIAHAAEQCERLRGWLGQGQRRVDLSGVTECDTAGLQLLLSARRSATAHGSPLMFENPSPSVAEALRCSGAILDC